MRTFFLLIILCISLSSLCQYKQILPISFTEMLKLAKAAKEPGGSVFIYTGADTIKGKQLKQKTRKWSIDGKNFRASRISAVQGKDGFIIVKNVLLDEDRYDQSTIDEAKRTGDSAVGFTRILKGKMNLYYYIADNAVYAVKQNGVINSSNFRRGTVTIYYLGKGEDVEAITWSTLNWYLKDCPAAIAKLKEESIGTFWEQWPDNRINNGRALLRIVEVYNTCNKY